jgi:hypothetical protein
VQTLQSIQTANHKYLTGDSPVYLLCSDWQDYVCKHALNGNATNLICEYLSASFLRLWELPVPEFCFVDVDYEHVKHLGIQKRNFDKTCFGSRFSKHFVELTLFNDEPDIRKNGAFAVHKLNILKIALFDIWLANEDRGHNNLNLLLDVRKEYNFIPIDHGAVFNSRLLDGHIRLLTENECLTNTDLLKHLFPKRDFSREFVQELKDYFYLCTHKCKQNFDEILRFIPPDWTIDLKAVTDKIQNEVFTNEWEDRVIETFLKYINSPFI